MLHTLMNMAAKLGRNKLQTAVLAGATLAGLGAAPTAALARIHFDIIVPVIVPAPPVYVDPGCGGQRHWVEPVYQTVTEQVWIPPVTATQMEHVDVPAQYGWRDCVSFDRYGYPHHFRQQIVICPPHCEDRTVQVVVTPGHYEQQTHQVLVCDGHWENIVAGPIVQPGLHIELPLPF